MGANGNTTRDQQRRARRLMKELGCKYTAALRIIKSNDDTQNTPEGD